jgi:Gas vesicle synthesis protein GvpO
LTGKEPEAITGFSATDGGWSITVDLLELERVPSTTSVIGSYETQIDKDGNLTEFRLAKRYVRGEAGER